MGHRWNRSDEGRAYSKAYKAANRERLNTERKARRAVWAAAGMCAGCGGLLEPGFKKCAKCHGQCGAAIAKKYEEYKAKKRAAYAPHPKPPVNTDEAKARHLKNARERYRERLTNGLCGICAKPRNDDRTRCDHCRNNSSKRNKEWNAANAARTRNRNLVKNYGITLIQWEMMFDMQGRMCALCGGDKAGTKGWQLDHCHTRGAVRAILCGPCNLGLGCFRDDTELMARASEYVRKHKALRAV